MFSFLSMIENLFQNSAALNPLELSSHLIHTKLQFLDTTFKFLINAKDITGAIVSTLLHFFPSFSHAKCDFGVKKEKLETNNTN